MTNLSQNAPESTASTRRSRKPLSEDGSEGALISKSPGEASAAPSALQPFFSLSPQAMTMRATQIANVLKDVIDKQGLAIKIGPGKPYVKSEGWATLGAFLGILPREREVTALSNGDYEAYVDLVRQDDGTTVGGASALCGADEKRWAAADRYARRSMAITRATGKAYRLSFAWIMTLAGYQPTPYEEMPTTPGYDPQNRQHQDWLIKKLQAKGVPEDQWDNVGNAIKGMQSEDAERVVESWE